jgi:hypothetical protein
MGATDSSQSSSSWPECILVDYGAEFYAEPYLEREEEWFGMPFVALSHLGYLWVSLYWLWRLHRDSRWDEKLPRGDRRRSRGAHRRPYIVFYVAFALGTLLYGTSRPSLPLSRSGAFLSCSYAAHEPN